MTRPNLLCLGPPKCGTTTLYTVCEGHPDVCVSNFKEPAFFSKSENFDRGLDWYLDTYFQHCAGEKIVAEFTPGYFTSKQALENIKAVLDADTKFIVVIRNPAKRAYSHYLHAQRDGLVTEPFDSFIRKLADKYKEGNLEHDRIGRMYIDSLYDIHFANYFSIFPDVSKLMLVKFEDDLKNDCQGFKQKLAGFAGLDIDKFPANTKAENSSQAISGFAMPVKRLMNTDNGLKRILKKIIPTYVRAELKVKIHSFINKNFRKEIKKIDERTLTSINKDIFFNSIKNTEKILNINLAEWY